MGTKDALAKVIKIKNESVDQSQPIFAVPILYYIIKIRLKLSIL